MKEKTIRVGFIGNPNCGKTTLFNALTGANLKVANWPGVTVEKKEGHTSYKGENFVLIDLPGIYSLTSYTMEEKVSRECILSDEVDLIVDVVDASCMERNLYLTLQLLELGKPVVVALNMMDIVEERGMEIDLHRLPEMLGTPVVPVSARRKSGLEVLLHAISHHSRQPKDGPLIHHHADQGQSRLHEEHAMVYSQPIEEGIACLSAQLPGDGCGTNARWIAIKWLEKDPDICKAYPQLKLPDEEGDDRQERKDLSLLRAQREDGSLETRIINEKYAFIEEVVDETIVNRESRVQKTDRIDAVMTGKWTGLPVFLVVMAIVFFLTFTVGDWLKGYFEQAIDLFARGVGSLLDVLHASPVLQSLVLDGVIAGVGGILTFLPNIFILFLALAFLEDSGYMARVAFVMDDIMGRIGLSGRAFLPMLLGFGCTVPAVMASRALEDPRDRFKTILVTPFMSCSARLPIYMLFSSVFFGRYAMIACYLMYVLGIAVAILTAFVLSIGDRKRQENVLLIELPEYKTPNRRTIGRYVWEKVKDYLQRAGTIIFLASVIMWLLLNFGPGGFVDQIKDSFGSVLGRWFVPLFAPIGLGYWQIIVALISGIAAKEVVVSSCSVLFGIASINSAAGMSDFYTQLGQMGFHRANAVAMMVFCLLYIPCTATIATITRELGKKAAFGIVMFQLATAWVMSFLIYQILLILW